MRPEFFEPKAQSQSDDSNVICPYCKYEYQRNSISGEAMTFYEFRGYGVNSSHVTIVLSRITHWWPIDYNGNHGTEIQLDTGKTVRVGHYDSDVGEIIRRAQTVKASHSDG